MPVWSVLERGLYALRHEGHDLIVKRLRKSDQIRGYEKKYEIYVDGILTDKGWNTGDSQRKAMRIVETLAPGEPVPPLSSRQAQPWTVAEADEPPTRAQQALAAIRQAEDTLSEPVPAPTSAVTYTLAGTMSARDTTEAVAAIRDALELLRQHGEVRCSMVMSQSMEI